MGRNNKWSVRQASNPFVSEPTSTRSMGNNTQAAGYAGKAGYVSGSLLFTKTDTMHKANDKTNNLNSSADSKSNQKTYSVNFSDNSGTNKFRGQQGNPQHFTVMSDSEVEEHVQGADFFGY